MCWVMIENMYMFTCYEVHISKYVLFVCLQMSIIQWSSLTNKSIPKANDSCLWSLDNGYLNLCLRHAVEPMRRTWLTEKDEEDQVSWIQKSDRMGLGQTRNSVKMVFDFQTHEYGVSTMTPTTSPRLELCLISRLSNTEYQPWQRTGISLNL